MRAPNTDDGEWEAVGCLTVVGPYLFILAVAAGVMWWIGRTFPL